MSGFFKNCSHQIPCNPPGYYYGAAITDMDNDGRLELMIANFRGPNLIYRFEHDRLESLAVPTLNCDHYSTISIAAADCDGDGEEEIYFLNTETYMGSKHHRDMLMDYRQGEWHNLFADNPAFCETGKHLSGRSVAALDRKGIGSYGFVTASYGGALKLVEWDGEQLADHANESGIGLITAGRALLCHSIISPYMDIFAANEKGPNYLFVNDGEGQFTEMATHYGIEDIYRNARGVASIDLNEDGRFDLILCHWKDNHRLWLREGNRFEDVAPAAMALASPARNVLVADFDNDGNDEIFFHNLDAPNRLFRFEKGECHQLPIGEAEEAEFAGTAAVYGDLDGDGMLELVLCHGEVRKEPISLFRAERNQNLWLRIQPLTRYGAPARGAVVTLYRGMRRWMKAIDAGSGYLGQMEPVAHFGLGANPEPYQVVVQWPDGRIQHYGELAANQLHRLPYPF
jgi:hypothetical protein